MILKSFGEFNLETDKITVNETKVTIDLFSDADDNKSNLEKQLKNKLGFAPTLAKDKKFISQLANSYKSTEE